jgi:lysyl-tRNA synthetase class 2
VRAPSATTTLGLGAAAAGAVGVVSALTPELASRSDFVQGVLPPGVPAAARVIVLALSLALIWLSRALARGKRRAWQLAVVLVVASAAAHLAKGLDFEEAAATLVLLAFLLAYRRRFPVAGDPATITPLLQVLLALGALVGLVVVRSFDGVSFSDRLEDALMVLAGTLAFRAFYLWLRPLRDQVRQSARARARAERLVHECGTDSLSFFTLRHDKNYFFSATGRSFLAYRVVDGSALVSGDPIGVPEELPELLCAFRSFASGRGWRVGILGASSEGTQTYRRLGWRALYLGDEAVVRPSTFSLDGRKMRKVRQSVNRLRRAGYRTRVVSPAEADERLRRELRAVSREWRGRWPERGFAMAMDGLFEYAEGVLFVAVDQAGRVGGFLQLVPAPAADVFSLAAMRRRRATPNGLMEYLIVEAIGWARERGVAELSLNFSVFAEALRADASSDLGRRALRLVLTKLDRIFQLERLYSFNRKFFPEWRPRYLCFERLPDLVFVALAYLRVESLLTPPGPWVQTTDLATR